MPFVYLLAGSSKTSRVGALKAIKSNKSIKSNKRFYNKEAIDRPTYLYFTKICYISPVSVNLPSAFKTFLFQASFPDIVIDPR